MRRSSGDFIPKRSRHLCPSPALRVNEHRVLQTLQPCGFPSILLQGFPHWESLARKQAGTKGLPINFFPSSIVSPVLQGGRSGEGDAERVPQLTPSCPALVSGAGQAQTGIGHTGMDRAPLHRILPPGYLFGWCQCFCFPAACAASVRFDLLPVATSGSCHQ